MRHCKSCRYCVVDTDILLKISVYIHRCKLKGHLITRPFFSGLRCRRYREDKRQ